MKYAACALLLKVPETSLTDRTTISLNLSVLRQFASDYMFIIVALLRYLRLNSIATLIYIFIGARDSLEINGRINVQDDICAFHVIKNTKTTSI